MTPLLMASVSAPAPFPNCDADFGVGLTCGVIIGFAAATFLWVCLHYFTRR